MLKNIGTAKSIFSLFFILTLIFGQTAFAQDNKKPEKKDEKIEKTAEQKAEEQKKIEKREEKQAKKEEKEAKKEAQIEVKNPAKGRLPVIIIPGLIGSELINKNTKEKVWFDLGRSKDDDLRLPISSNLKNNRDNLIPGDILRKIQLVRLTPEIEIYQKLIDTLRVDGFTEGKFDEPKAGDDADTFYVFAYDWRLDNVENAQNLLTKIDAVRTKLNRPDLKFNIIAHSMGGLIARYAAMYGKADLRTRNPRPTWRGNAYINSISMVATPNSGALSSLDSLLNGFSLFGSGKLNLPFIQNLSKYDLFTIPSVYQLLPHTGTARAFDENLKPIKIDVLNSATWEKYGWTAFTDADFAKKFSAEEQRQAKSYFNAVLLRAKLFHTALDASPSVKSPIPMFYLGAECRPTIDGMIIRKDAKKNVWKTEFGTTSYEKANGEKVTKEQTEAVLLTPGDGVVPKRSLIASFMKLGRLRNIDSSVLVSGEGEACSEHNRLTGNEIVTKNLLDVLNNRSLEGVTTAKNEK